MIKSELIQSMASQYPDLAIRKIATGVNLILDAMQETLMAGKRVEIRQFGCFSVRIHGPRKVRNPKTGIEWIAIGKATPHFKPGQYLKKKVDEFHVQKIEM